MKQPILDLDKNKPNLKRQNKKDKKLVLICMELSIHLRKCKCNIKELRIIIILLSGIERKLKIQEIMFSNNLMLKNNNKQI